MLIRISFFAALGGFLFGYDLGLIGGALLGFSEDLGIDSTLTQETIVGALKFGAFFGTFIGGAMMLRYGRRPAIAATAVTGILGPVCMAAATNAVGLVIGRVLSGLGIGASAIVVPAYLAELAPAAHRGAMVQVYEIMLCIGMLISTVVDWALHTVPHGWRWMVGLPALPGAVIGLALLVLPESPRWLVMQGRLEEALDTLQIIMQGSTLGHLLGLGRLQVAPEQILAQSEDELLHLWSSVEKDFAVVMERRAAVVAARRNNKRRRALEHGGTGKEPLLNGADPPSHTGGQAQATGRDWAAGGSGDGGQPQPASAYISLTEVAAAARRQREGQGHAQLLGNGGTRSSTDGPGTSSGGIGAGTGGGSGYDGRSHWDGTRHATLLDAAAAEAGGGAGPPLGWVPQPPPDAPMHMYTLGDESDDSDVSGIGGLYGNQGALQSHAGHTDALLVGQAQQQAMVAGQAASARSSTHGQPTSHASYPGADQRGQQQQQQQQHFLGGPGYQPPAPPSPPNPAPPPPAQAGGSSWPPPDLQVPVEATGMPGMGTGAGSSGEEGLLVSPRTQQEMTMPGKEKHFLATLGAMLWDIKAVMRGPEARACAVACWLAVFNQATASTAIINFAPTLLKRLGSISNAGALAYTIVIALTKVIGVGIGLLTVDVLGRRPLLMGGSAGCALAMAAATASAAAASAGALLFCMCLFVLAFSISWAGVYWVVVSEVFSMAAKSPASSAATSLLFLSGAATNMVFLLLVDWLSHGAFLVFAVVAVVSGVYVWAALPETKGRTLAEVQDLMTRPPARGRIPWLSRFSSQGP